MNNVMLMLGSNVGDSKAIITDALDTIEQEIGQVKSISSVYKTAPWGFSEQNDFLNQAVLVHTPMHAPGIMDTLLSIEKKAGRIRAEKNAARTLDIDILFFNNDIIETQILTIPHPRLHERNFVLKPLLEIIPDFVHPVLKKTIRELCLICSDTLTVHKLS
jgi:2-amino-4-hydroxy-6-hydroxymethyldihydropteridine diphosphokinase